MKALTICQPYAHLIMTGKKRVENRTWPTSYRGLMYIHAGKSREWLDVGLANGHEIDFGYGIRLDSMAFGAVVAIARLVDCVSYNDVGKGIYLRQYPWLGEHEHASGPWCWILDSVSPIGPWPWRGAQGLFDIDSDELNRVANRALGIKEPSEARS